MNKFNIIDTSYVNEIYSGVIYAPYNKYLAIDKFNNKWISSDDRFLKYNNGALEEYTLAASIWSLAIDSNDFKWMGTGAIIGNSCLVSYKDSVFEIYDNQDLGLDTLLEE